MGGHLDDAAAVHLADHAAREHVLRGVAVLDEGGILLEEVGEAIAAEGHAALAGHVVVAELLHAGEEGGVGVGLVQLAEVAVVRGHGAVVQGLEHVGVELGDDDLADLPGQGAARVGDHLRLELVALVDDEGEAAVAADLQILHAAAQIGRHAVAMIAAARIVVHLNDREAVDHEGLAALELVVLAQGQHGLRLLSETLVHLLEVSACQVHSACHKLTFLLSYVIPRAAKEPKGAPSLRSPGCRCGFLSGSYHPSLLKPARKGSAGLVSALPPPLTPRTGACCAVRAEASRRLFSRRRLRSSC